jgi:uncharacterized membrane protein YfhO
LRVNLAMRGIFLLPGSHRIVFSYEPPGWKIGIALSTLSLALLVALLLAGWLRRRTLTQPLPDAR